LVEIKVISVGKTKESWIREGLSHYQKLLIRYAELHFWRSKRRRSPSPEPQKIFWMPKQRGF
jgi:23S rRNA pseudoU1915 N3-methylase RlmH